MRLDVRRNPALLKLDLYCQGARIDDSLEVAEDGGRPVMRTRAGLGSGLEVILPHGLWTNIPVAESFARSSPYVVRRRNDGSIWLDRSGEPITKIRLAPRPSWYDRKTSTGKPMTSIGTLQGTYLGIYPSKVCEFWTRKPQRVNCKFCSVGLNLGRDDAEEKKVQEVVEVATAARDESGITYVDFNSGHYEDESFLDTLEPYVTAVKEATGCLVGIQTPPHGQLQRYDHLREIGANRASFCFEIFDPGRFAEVCPGKSERYGLNRYLEAVEYCAGLRRRGWFSFDPWVSNGEIIAGLEDPRSSIDAIDWCTSVGAIPTVCVFRPLKGTDYEAEPTPDTESMIPIFAALYESCMRRRLPIGLAPNVHVSLVMLPWECRWLVPARVRRRYAAQEARLGLQRLIFKQLLNRSLRHHDALRKARSADSASLAAS